MAIIKSFSPLQNLSNYGTFVVDTNPNSDYFRITEFNETFTGGKNGFLIEGSEFLKETTEVKIEILDVEGNPIYYEPGDGIPEYYEGVSKLVSVHVYEDTPIGLGKITILGELKTYVDDNGVVRDIPNEWRGSYNLKWEKTFNINKNLNNETIVRFYKRPQITIDEVVKPIFSKTTPSITQSGSVIGISQTPTAGTNLSNWTAGTFYKLKISDDSNWTSSVDENIINIPSLGYSPVVREVLNNKEVIVDIPFANNNIVSDFTASEYSTTFEFVEGQTIGESALTGSFAKINIKQLKTFVGDVARVKVYRKSRNDVGDFQFVQESKLESTELLRDITTAVDTEISYGNFTDYNLETYWTSSNPVHPISLDVQILNAAVKVNYDTTLGGVQQLITTEEFTISKDVEYTLSFKTLLSGSVDESKTLTAYLSSSDYRQTFLKINGSAIYQARQNVSQNIIATDDVTAKLVFEYTGDDWYTSNISLKNAQETSFSPDEFILIQEIPRNLPQETFDFRFEFYDINNNYIPVDVTATKVFTGGNNFPTSGKLLSFGTDRTVFRFSSGSLQNPPNQQVKFTVSQTNLTGSVLFESSAFDTQGNYLNPTDYIVYPGQLTSVNPAGAILTINNFTGSRVDGNETPYVGSIIFTASIDGLSEFETVYRLEDGENAPGLFVTSDANQFVYKATDLSPNPANQLITFLAKRKNLESTTTPIIINSDSVPSLTLLDTDAGTGVSTFSLSIGNFPYNKNSPSASYYFTASDEFGNEQYDSITLSQVKILDGLSVTLTNDNASLPALSTGFVPSGSFVLTSGSVSVKVGNESITHSNGLIISNSFDVVSAVPIGVSTGSLTYSTPDYFITRLDADSGSLELRVRYKDGAGDTTDVTKVVSYTKNKKAAPVLSFVIGNNNQSTDAKSTGVQLTGFVNSNLSVNEQYNGVTTALTLLNAPTINSSSTFPGIAKTTSNLTYPTMSSAVDSVELSITGSVIDSENTTRQVFGNVSLTKIKKTAPVVIAILSNDGQSITKSKAGVYAVPAAFTLSVNEGGSNYTYDDSVPYADSTFRITSISGGTGTTTITPTTPTTDAGTTTNITITYVNSEGTSGTIIKEHKVNVTIDGTDGEDGEDGADGLDGAAGQTGPGVVSTGIWDVNRTLYQFSVGATGRRDVVLWSTNGNAPYEVYYATIRQHVPAVGNVANGAPHQPNQTGWESLGTQDFFVAAKIGLFEDSYVQSTLNIGTNNNGGVSSANITLAGGSTNPYLSIGQGTQGYSNDGIFLGRDSSTSKFSLVNGTTSFLKWTGTSLEIKGTIRVSSGEEVVASTITNAASALQNNQTDKSLGLSGGTVGGITIAPTKIYIGTGTHANANTPFYADNTGKFSLKDKLTWDGTNLNVTGTIRVSSGEEVVASTITNAASALQSGQTGKSLGLTGGSVGGVTIASNKIYIGAGNYNNADTGFYVDNSGNFSLKDKLTWNGTTLSINGNGTFSGALSAATGTFSGALSAATGTFNGSIRIGSGTSVFTADTNGIYLGSETPTSAPFRVTPNGSLSAANANLTGNITATSGRIGNWIISGEGSLQNSNSKLKINPVTPGIEIYDQFDAKRLDMHFGPLTYLGAVSVTFTPPAITIPNVTLTGAVPDTRVYSSTSSTFSAAQAGTYQAQITFPSLGVIGQISDATNSYVAVGVGIEVRNTSGDAVAAYTTQFTDPLGASPGVQNIELLANTAFLSLNLPASGNYTVYSYYYYYAFIQSGVTAQLFSTAVSYSSITLDLENNLVEITNDGIQVATSAVQYLRMPRQAGGTIIDGRGRTLLFANSTTDYTLSCQNTDVTGDAIYVYATDRGIYVEQGTCWRTGIATWNVISDRRVKKNEEAFTGGLDIIKKLKPKTFEYINPADKGPNSDGVQVGFIAQDLEEIWPSWVSDGKLPSGSKDIVPTESDYDSNLVSGSVNIKGIGFGNDFFAMLVGSIQELSAKVEMLEAKLSGSNDSVN